MSATCAVCARRPGMGALCWWHFDAFARMLDPDNEGTVFDPARPDDPRVLPSVPVLFGWLDAAFGVSGEQDHSGVFRSAPPGRLGVMALRDRRSRPFGWGPDDHREGAPLPVLAVLGRLVARVDRADVDGRLEHRPPRTVADASGWLHARREWLASAGWVGEAWSAVKALHGQLRGAWGDPAMAPLGNCVKRVDDDGRLDEAGRWSCGVPLFLPEQPPKALDQPLSLPSLRCGSCGWTYLGPELVRLAREREQRQAQAVA